MLRINRFEALACAKLRMLQIKMISIMQKHVIKLFSVIGLALVLSACGFHLRGNIPLSDSIKNMYLNAPEGTFKQELERGLTRQGAVLSASKEAADVVLTITKVDSDRTVGTLDDRGKANSFNLLLKVNYNLKTSDNKIIRKLTKLVEVRRYDFDPQFVVETELEEVELLESMEEEIVLRIVRQLAVITEIESQEKGGKK